jgi:tetratricopeptide (TPR) repeat protein
MLDPPPAGSTQKPAEAMSGSNTTPVDGTVLPWGPTTPTPEMLAIAQRAEEVARRGYDLAERGGMYSARARFTESLRIIAEALDGQRNTTAHTKALAAGLRALDEVDDFVPRGGKLDGDFNLTLIVDAHRTPVLKARPLDGVTPLVAQRMYLTYAQEQLAMAGGDQAVASLALHGLAKICVSPVELHGPRVQIAEAKAVVYFQAAMIIEPRNFMSANELGVLLARFGRPQEARQAFEQAVLCSNAPTTWRNLAMVNERLGDVQKASICRERAASAVALSQQAGTNNGGSQYSVRWVDQETFAKSNTMVPDLPTPATTADAKAASPVPATAAKPAAKSSGWKWPWQ